MELTLSSLHTQPAWARAPQRLPLSSHSCHTKSVYAVARLKETLFWSYVLLKVCSDMHAGHAFVRSRPDTAPDSHSTHRMCTCHRLNPITMALHFRIASVGMQVGSASVAKARSADLGDTQGGSWLPSPCWQPLP